jgi:predicted RNase H-like HicB family nuclease
VKKYQLAVKVEPLEDGRFLAVSPDLQGCLAEGDTIAEAIENIEDAARIIIELRTEKGWILPPELGASEEPPIVEAKVVVSVGG